MNRKDMIIVAVLLNVVVLSALFVLAVNSEDPLVSDGADIGHQIVVENKLPATSNHPPALLAAVDDPADDDKLELILGDLDSSDGEPSRDQEWALFASRPTDVESKISEEVGSDNIVEIIVKKGDSLDRIARANATSVQSIRALNGLKNDHLKIGQVLIVDVGSAKKVSEQRPVQPPQPITQKNIFTPPKDAVYYTVKSGDSPWKIAKQFNVNMDDLLKLNQLNEEKARNLKVGDRIRVQ